MKRALIIGSRGQDGSYLTEQLEARGVEVWGLSRQGVTVTGRSPPPGVAGASLLEAGQLDALVRVAAPEALFFLAAYQHSSEQAQGADPGPIFSRSFSVHVDAWVCALESLRRHAPACRAFYAASSHVFGQSRAPTQNEETPFAPLTPYAISKAAGVEVARFYRRLGQHVSVGLLYNHESPRRPLHFVTQRIAHAAAEASRGSARVLELGDLSAVVDWSWAPDVTDAMARITAWSEPGDWVVASGEPHTVAELCEASFAAVGLEWRGRVVEAAARLHRRPGALVGDAGKVRRLTGWAPTVPFPELARRLVRAALGEGGPRP